jgi:hypothetical protein
LSLRTNLNTGTSEKLQNAFPNIIPIPRPTFLLQDIYDPQWLTGFIDGEGCFIINIQNCISSVDGRIYNKVWLTFFITQHFRDVLLMESLIKYLDYGQVVRKSSMTVVNFKVGKFDNITTKVIPFLQKYPLQSVKQKDYQDWVEASILIGNKEHLTSKGLEKINIIKNGMNKKRAN